MDDQLRLDRQLTDFFSEAKAVSLTSDERELSRFVIESHMMANSVSLVSPERLEGMAHGPQSAGFQDLALNEKEKREVRNNIIAFMRENPRYAPEADAQTFSLYRIFELAFPRFALGMLVFVVAGAGVTYASQATVPGDFLYPFKVSVYEPVVSKLATSDTSQAAWEARRAQNRLKEAARLSAESRLDKETAEKLRKQFEAHIASAQKGLDTLKAVGKQEVAVSISSEMETYLESNAAVIREISSATGDSEQAATAAVSITASEPATVAVPAAAKHMSHSLTEKVQTILNALPAVIPSSSESSSSLASVDTSSKGKVASSSSRPASSSSTPAAVPSSSAKPVLSSAAPSSASAVASSAPAVQPSSAAVPSSAPQASSAQQQSSAASLLPQLFEDIMDSTSSIVPPLPQLLP